MNRIALVMIVRNEARCLARCLASARPWVDEMLVLDTGSTDATPQIARDSGARVLHFDWVDDFSAARNAALAATEAPWRLLLDGDEWVASGGEAIADLRGQAPDFLGLVTVSSHIDSGGTREEAPSWLPRLLPRGVLYEGRIHEQPVSAWPRRRLPLVLGHDGYLGAQLRDKAGRNERLLRLALAERPGDAYLMYQLGKDLEVRDEFAAAAPHYEAAHGTGDRRAAWRHDLVVRWLFTLKKLRRFEAALQLAEAEMPHWGESPDFFFTLGDLLLDWALAEPARAGELLPMIESSWLRAIEIGERPELPDSVRGRGSFLAAHNLAAFHASLGREDEAQRWRAQASAWRGRTGPG
jgi:glycosyltransferase involved in cell wall biosynthesis